MHIELKTDSREQMVDITRQVSKFVAEQDVRDGAVHVFVSHTTAGVTINENADPDVCRDLLDGLRRISPRDAGWRHSEGNSDAHLKATLVGSSVTVPVHGGRLSLGTWQGVYFCEFDGPRTRGVTLTMLSSAQGTPASVDDPPAVR